MVAVLTNKLKSQWLSRCPPRKNAQLNIENYVSFGALTEDLSQGAGSESSEGLL